MELILVLVSTLISPAILLVMNKKIKETHKQVTVNHHSSESPTILDKLDDLQQAFNRHLEWHLTQDKDD